MTAPEAKVLRNSKWSTIDAKELVPGDIVQVRVGDCVPADMRVAEIHDLCLSAEQACLTGETVPEEKITETCPKKPDMAIQDQHNMLFSSTHITVGTATGIVTSTGMTTEVGKISTAIESTEEEDTPLK